MHGSAENESHLGVGLGFRFPHARDILSSLPAIPWFEVIADDLLYSAARRKLVDRLRQDYPLALHAVGLNVGGNDPVDDQYVGQISELIARYEPCWMSDHLCWTGHAARQHFDLLPMPFTERQQDHVVDRVTEIQERLGMRLQLENLSYYVRFDSDEMSEWEFHAGVCGRSGCGTLLDLNNIWTNAMNFGGDPGVSLRQALDTLDVDGIGYLHLAGSTEQAGATPYWIDTHGEPVLECVIELFRELKARCPNVPAILERDHGLPAFSELSVERNRLAEIEQVSRAG